MEAVIQSFLATLLSCAEVRATIYGTMDPGRLRVLVPAGFSGPPTARVTALSNGSIHSYTYANLITT